MKVVLGEIEDIESWMELVKEVRWKLPGLDTDEEIEEHKNTVIEFMKQNEAMCVKDNNMIVGVLLYSKEYNMICCLAVAKNYRKNGIASMLLKEALKKLDKTKNIVVSTFREDDPNGIAPRALYKKFGFVEDELIEEFGYPSQKFVLYS